MQVPCRDQTAVITGAGNGLGRALAVEFARQGFHLALMDIDEDALKQTERQLASCPQRVTTHCTDIAQDTAIADARSEILLRHAGIDLLINNAGVSVSRPFEQTTDDEFRWLFDINFWGTLRCTRHFLPDLIKSNGRLANIISSFAWIGFPGKSAYAASKGAIAGLTNTLRTEYSGIRVSLVIPPPLHTGLVRNGLHTDERKRAAEENFLARNGMSPEKAASVIARGILAGRYRIVVGNRTKLSDLAARLFPSMTHRLIARMKHRFDFY